MPILFIAVQCCQCSTMQVKQQKKSGNKWTCVVCNQKQSIRKVFSQGYMAKDLRKFVQSFNMSRKFTEQQQPHSHGSQTLASQIDYPGFGVERKRRTDWSEYLDEEEEHPVKDYSKQEEDGADEFEGQRIVTEWPEEVLKKPRLRYYAAESSATADGGESNDGNRYKPVFAKRAIKKAASLSQGKKPKTYNSTKTLAASKCSGFKQETNRTSALPTAKPSKWSDYITHYEDDLIGGKGTHFADQTDGRNIDNWENIMVDEKVVDDIHPDFM